MNRSTGGWIGVDSPAARGAAAPWRAYGWAAGIVVGCALLDSLLVRRLHEANLVMVFFLGVLAVALRGDLRAAVFASVLAVLAFDVFFVPPYLTFAVDDTEYIFTFLAMGVVGGAISTLVARLAAELASSQRRERQVRGLYELSQSLLKALEPLDVLAEGVRVVRETIGQPVGAWLASPGGPREAVPLDRDLSPNDYEILRLVLKEGVPTGPGTSTFEGASSLILPIRTSQTVYGALGLSIPEGAAPLDRKVREALEVSANQLAIALEQHRNRQEADVAKRQAAEERVRSALLSAVSHDLRTPLTSIIGAAASLVDGAEALDPATRRALAQDVVDEAERLNRLVSNLLHATRLSAGTVKLVRHWSSFDEILGAALARLDGWGRQVQVKIPPDLPALEVDVALMEQALYNLIENARKHTPEGTSVQVRAWEEGNVLAVEIADRGPGLPVGEEERIFEKFRSLGRGRVAPGAGLGLAIVRGVIEAHGGRIQAQNRPGGGAAFRFTIPLGRVSPTPAMRS